jgi:hypothetical protein
MNMQFIGVSALCLGDIIRGFTLPFQQAILFGTKLTAVHRWPDTEVRIWEELVGATEAIDPALGRLGLRPPVPSIQRQLVPIASCA